MKMNYVVVAKADGIEYNIGCAGWIVAFNHYEKYATKKEFHTVYLMDKHTGEIYAYRDIIEDEWGIEVKEWQKKM